MATCQQILSIGPQPRPACGRQALHVCADCGMQLCGPHVRWWGPEGVEIAVCTEHYALRFYAAQSTDSFWAERAAIREETTEYKPFLNRLFDPLMESAAIQEDDQAYYRRVHGE